MDARTNAALGLAVTARNHTPQNTYTLTGVGGKTDGSDNTAAAQALLSKAAPGAHLIFDIPNARITSPLVADLGGISDVTIEMQSPIRPQAGIGVALTVKNGTDVRITAAFNGGGQGSDIGLKILNLKFPVVRVFGTSFAGTVLNIDGTLQDGTYNQFCRIEEVRAYNCGMAVLHGTSDVAKYGDSFGSYEFVWDMASANGSLIQNVHDLNIKYWENYASSSQVYSLDLENCSAVHASKVLLGGDASGAMLKLNSGSYHSWDEIYLVSATPGAHTGLLTNLMADCDIKRLKASQLAVGANIQGTSSVCINRYAFLNCTSNLQINGSTVTSANFGTFSQTDIIRNENDYTANGSHLGFITPSGYDTYGVCQSDGNMVFYAPQSGGTEVPVWSYQTEGASGTPFQTAQPFRPGSVTLATANGYSNKVNGSELYITDGRKSGEGAGAGTGVRAIYTNGAWRDPSQNYAAVTN